VMAFCAAGGADAGRSLNQRLRQMKSRPRIAFLGSELKRLSLRRHDYSRDLRLTKWGQFKLRCSNSEEGMSLKGHVWTYMDPARLQQLT
jgi:hypothetical protein